MPTLFPLPAPLPQPWAHRLPAMPEEYRLDAFRALLRRLGARLGDAARHPEAMAFLRRREAVLQGRWPLYTCTDRDACPCGNHECTHGHRLLHWHCPLCERQRSVYDALNSLFGHYTCAELTRGFHDNPARQCPARFEAREEGGVWRLFLKHETGNVKAETPTAP